MLKQQASKGGRKQMDSAACVCWPTCITSASYKSTLLDDQIHPPAAPCISKHRPRGLHKSTRTQGVCMSSVARELTRVRLVHDINHDAILDNRIRIQVLEQLRMYTAEASVQTADMTLQNSAGETQHCPTHITAAPLSHQSLTSERIGGDCSLPVTTKRMTARGGWMHSCLALSSTAWLAGRWRVVSG